MDPDELAIAFEAERRHLQRVAYGILGSLGDAEDVVQDAWLRLARIEDPTTIRDLRGWATRTVSRLALDVLGSARARRERYVGPWLPEPVVALIAHAGNPDADLADRVAREEEISLALLIVLERLSPAERAAFLLHDVFGYEFAEAAQALGRTPAATRQLAARARAHVDAGRPRFPPDGEERRRIVHAFSQACSVGDLDGLVGLLAPDAVWRTDGGGRVTAARREHRGAERVARGLIALARHPPLAAAEADVNGAPGLVLRGADGRLTVIALTVDGGLITAVDIVRNPDKLTRVPEPPAL